MLFACVVFMCLCVSVVTYCAMLYGSSCVFVGCPVFVCVVFNGVCRLIAIDCVMVCVLCVFVCVCVLCVFVMWLCFVCVSTCDVTCCCV